MPRTLVRDKQVRKVDDLDDQKTALDIASAPTSGVVDLATFEPLVLSQLRRIIWGDSVPAKHWYEDFISAGLKPLLALEDVEKVAFAYNTASPMTLQAVNAGAVLDRASLLITTAFDGVGATLQLGTSGTPGMVLGPSESLPGVVGQYETSVLTQFPLSDFLQLTITPSGSTQGAGLLLYKLRR